MKSANRTWESYFTKATLRKGKDLCLKKAIKDVSQKGNTVYAHIRGRRTYFTSIDFDTKMMECDCETAKEDFCEHMAALMYLCYEMLGIVTEVKKTDNSKRIKAIRAKLRRALASHTSYHGVVEDYEVPELASKVNEILNDIVQMARQSRLWDAVNISVWMLSELGQVTIEDDGDIMGFCTMNIYELWRHIYNTFGQADRERLYQEMVKRLAEADKEGAKPLGRDARESIEDMLVDFYADGEHGPEIIDHLEQRLRQVEDRPDGRYSRMDAERYALSTIIARRQAGATPAELYEATLKKWEYDSVKGYYINDCMERGSYKEAETLIKEVLKEMVAEKWPMMAQLAYHRLLWVIYLETKEKKKLGQEAEWLLAHGEWSDRWQAYRYLKEQRPELYAAHREQFIDQLAEEENEFGDDDEDAEQYAESSLVMRGFVDADQLKAVIAEYQDAGLHDKAVRIILHLHGVEPVLHEYKEYMLEHAVRADYLGKLEDEINGFVDMYASRKNYQHMLELLQEIEQLPGGKALAKRMVKNWREVYVKRKALMETLDEAGR